MPRKYNLSHSSWNDVKDLELIETVQASKKISEGLRIYSRETNTSLDAVRNRWYNPKLKKMREVFTNVDLQKTEDVDNKDVDNKNDQQEHSSMPIIQSEPIINNHPYLPFKIENEVTKEARLAISDIKQSLEFLSDGLTRLVRSNHDLVKEIESTKIEYNRLLKDHKEMSESYTLMLKMINDARKLALQEEDEKQGISSNSKRKYKADSNGNLNAR